MAKSIKRTVGAISDKVVPYRALLSKVRTVEAKLDDMQRELHHTQLQINHNQMQLLQDTHDMVKNSGSIVLSESEIVTKIFSGLKVYLDPRDLAVVPHLALDGIWEHQITAAWLSVVRPTDTVIDIGANFGYFGLIAAQQTDKKHSKVVMFEANPALIPYINKSLSVNWLHEQTTVENLAVADKQGEVVLNILKDYLGSSSLHSAEKLDTYLHDKMHVETAQQVTVPAVTIDDYCKTHAIKTVDLIKMDIEGFEDKAYEGMRHIIKASPNATLFIEFTKDGYDDPQGFYEQLLADFGHVYTIDEDGAIKRPASTSYESVIGNADDWVMPIFSKKSDLGAS